MTNNDHRIHVDHWVFRPVGRLLKQPAFLVCVMLLAICAGGLHFAAAKMKWHFRKEALPLKKPLDQMDLSRIAPYEVVEEFEISEEIEAELGTKDYIQWVLRDTSRPSQDPLSLVSFFVTYYTGNPDKVPHVPDVCYVGGGGNVHGKQNVNLAVSDAHGQRLEMPYRLLNIQVPGWSGLDERLVGYTFAVNGTFACQRDQVRLMQNSIRDRYAYFSKIEVFFPLAGRVERQQVVTAMETFLDSLMPVLLSEHLPVSDQQEWDILNRSASDS